MLWLAAACVNALIGFAFVMIAYSIVSGLFRTGQLSKNSLGLGTAAIFASCAAGHLVHAFHLVFVEADPLIGGAVRQPSMGTSWPWIRSRCLRRFSTGSSA